MTSNLSWNTQTQKVVNKANKIVGFLKRNVGPGNKEVFSRLYKALVIPILEYAVPLLSPYLQMNIDALERVQRRASKYALPMSSRDSPNEERLVLLLFQDCKSSQTKTQNYLDKSRIKISTSLESNSVLESEFNNNVT